MALQINKMKKETPLHPNMLFTQIVELEGDCAKTITTFGFITTNRLSKIKRKQMFYLIIEIKNNTYTEPTTGF